MEAAPAWEGGGRHLGDTAQGMKMALGRCRGASAVGVLAQSKAAPGSQGRWLQLCRDLLKSLQVTNVSLGVMRQRCPRLEQD